MVTTKKKKLWEYNNNKIKCMNLGSFYSLCEHYHLTLNGIPNILEREKDNLNFPYLIRIYKFY